MASMQAVRDITEGRKLTDDVILPLLRIIRANTGIAFVEPAVLMSYEVAILPNLSGASRALLIVHLGMREDEGHWVLTTYQNGIVTLYDSLNQLHVCPQLKATVESVFGKDKEIRLVPVATPQANSNDCGVLACAYAVDWALGHDPADTRYEYASLRAHLVTLLRHGVLVAFPRLLQIRVEATEQAPSKTPHSVQEKQAQTIDQPKEKMTARTEAIKKRPHSGELPTKGMFDLSAATEKQRHSSECAVEKRVEDNIAEQSIVDSDVGFSHFELPTTKIPGRPAATKKQRHSTECAVGKKTEEKIVDSNNGSESGDSDSGDDLDNLKHRVAGVLRKKFGIRVEIGFHVGYGEKVTRFDSFLGLCHSYRGTTDYYSVIASLPETTSGVSVYDFCGRKEVNRLTRREKSFRGYFSSKITLTMRSAPCSASKTDPTKSCLLSLLTMLYLARKMDPFQHILFEADVVVLRENLLALIDDCLQQNESQHLIVSMPPQESHHDVAPQINQQPIEESMEVVHSHQDEAEQVPHQHGEESLQVGELDQDEIEQVHEQHVEDEEEEDIQVLKVRVMERIEEIKHTAVIEYPKFPESFTQGDFFGLIRIVNKQSGNDYYSALHCPFGDELVIIHDFCGRTYGRDILELEKKFAATALRKPGVRCKLMRYPTVATKKDTTKCLLYSLLTLLYLAQDKNVFERVDSKSDVAALRLHLCRALRGEQLSAPETEPVRPLYQRRRSSASITTDLGNMNIRCYCCGALYFSCEVEQKSGPQYKCCKSGRIATPRRRDAPEQLRRLMTEQTAEARQFRVSIYRYNSALAFASIFARCPTIGQGAQAFIVQGQMYTTMYPGRAGNSSTPKGNQMYFLDIEEGVASRVEAFSGLNASVVGELLRMLHECNRYAAIYKTMRDYVNSRPGRVPDVNLAMRADLNAAHRGTGAMPTSDEVVVVYNPSEEGEFGSMAVYSLAGDAPRKVHLNSPCAEPLLFPLLNPRGESGYERTKDFTLREYCMYLLARRDEFSTFKYGGRLKQAYMCFNCLKMEDDRLSWISKNQGTLRAEMYKGLHDWVQRRAEEAHAGVGRVVVLPATFTGGPRYMHRKYLDSLAAVCHFGRYDVFITITTNPRWPEITANIPPGQTVADNCDLVNRVFHAKLLKFIDLIEKQQILGDVAAWLYVIEFQKRGLPHAHFVLIFTPQYTADNEARVDELVTAEIPEEDGIDRDLVLEFMLHEPCRSRPSAKCRRGPSNACRHDFPKEFSSKTRYGGSDQRTEYMRRPSKKPGLLNGQIVDNDYVVPTNLKLLRALQCHVNVEIFQPLLGVKYLFKYLQKGENRDTIQINYDVAGEPRVANNDEVQHFQTHRYLSCYEADWRLRASLITDCSHVIVRLPVHLPSEQMVYFVEGGEEEALRSAEDKPSQLLAWFQLNRRDAFARSLKYVDIPTHYVWNNAQRSWLRRQKRGERVIVRMYDVQPSMGELFYLRLILLHSTGATSYEDLRNVSGTVHDTFKEACQAMGILADDAEYVRCLTDAVSVKSPGSLRRLFVQILFFGAPTDPHSLYDMFAKDMSDDYQGEADDELQRKRYLDVRLRASLERLGYDFVSNGMEFLLVDSEMVADFFEARECSSTQARPSEDRARELEQTFNEGQRAAYEAIVSAVQGGRNCLQSRVFFLDGAAGTGKTHLLNSVIEIVESRIQTGLVFAMAWSGLAASLLRNGRTVHSTLKLPFAMDDSAKVGLTFQSARTLFIRDSPLIIWDEISMTHVKAVTAFDSWLRLLMGNDRPFGDKVVVFAGDFRQILPVVPAADPETVVRVIVKNSLLWRSVHCLKLSESMRVTADEREFSDFLLAVGEGNVSVPHGIPVGSIVIPENMLCSKKELVEFVLDRRLSVHDAIILSVRNSDVDDMNALVAKFSCGEKKTYLSSDCNAYSDDRQLGAHTDPEYRHNLPIEYLNRMNPPSMPPHRLTLTVGQPVMLLRNLDVAAGLCNGKRLIVTELRDNLVVCSRADSEEPVLLCRHRFTTIENRDAVPFVRLQYPIKLAYACTVHKSQGQTFNRVGLYLRHSVFTHGMLYVAMSRVRRSCDLKICIEQGDGQGTRGGVAYTRNVVFRDVLQ